MGFSIWDVVRWLRLSLTGWGVATGPQYRHFRKIILPTSRGSSEIDHLIVSPFGLFVIEYKTYSGWIFGDAMSRNWTAVYFKEKHSFQNPLHQNFGHVKAVQELLGVDARKVHSAVVFRGRFEFKTDVPRGVFLHSCSSWVGAKKQVLLGDPEVERIIALIESRAGSGFFAERAHTLSVKRRYRSATICPKCGGDLVPRVARRGPLPGSRFLGCSNYPACKYIRN
jgi:hypothetical protein